MAQAYPQIRYGQALSSVAFLFDVDNTLLDNDRVKADLAAGIEAVVGKATGAEVWEIYEDVRRMRDYVDYPHTLQRFREAVPTSLASRRSRSWCLGIPIEPRSTPAR